MKKFKYNIPERVMNCFSEDITEVIYKGNVYERDICYYLHQQGALEEYVVNEYLNKYKNIIKDDFKEYVTTIDIFNNKLKQFNNDLQSYLSSNELLDDCVYLVTISSHTYSDFIFSIDEQHNILKVTDNCATGINQNIGTFLKNKKNFISNFEYTFQIVNTYQTFEDVYKWYYFKKKYADSSTSGAGVLTGWLTEEEALRRSKGCELIRLNSNFRLIKGN